MLLLVLFREEQLRFLVVFRVSLELLLVIVLYFVLIFGFRLCVFMSGESDWEIERKTNNVRIWLFNYSCSVREIDW